MIAHYRTADLDAVLSEVGRYWDDVLDAVQVKDVLVLVQPSRSDRTDKAAAATPAATEVEDAR